MASNAADDTTRPSADRGKRDDSPRANSESSGVPEVMHPIVFFDGVCELCNRTVDFLLRRDPAGVFRFAPLQGETARTQLPAGDVESRETIVLLDEQGRHRGESAAVRILWRLGRGWKVAAGLLWLFPRPVRDAGYRLVSSTRYRLFGKKETCRTPTPDEREWFLP